MTDFYPLTHVIEFAFVFLCEGVKAHIRFTYSLLKAHKKLILQTQMPVCMMQDIVAQSKGGVVPYSDYLHYATKFKMGSADSYKFSSQADSSELV